MNKKYEDPSCGNQISIWTSEVVNVLIQKIKECILYNKVIKQSCEHRVTEGTYINDSLHKLSSDIINIISFKNQNTVYYLPSFVDKCLPAYCPNQSTCFSMTTKKSDPQIESTILISIYEYLNDGKKYDIIAERESVIKFYNDIEICVFCVFNWSRSANNPPPVPYVDINDLKQMVYKKESFTIQEFQSLINLKISQLKKDKMYFNTAIETLTEILAIKEINSNTIDKDIKPKLESIEKTNATTAIGTIEFTDRIGKLNTISNSCSINSSKDNNYAYIYPKPPKRNKK
jgi:polyhydroxyalkanoate synthesis regulator protein